MATFTFRKTKIQEVQKAMKQANEPHVWFIGTFGGGCLQVLDKEDKVIANVFANSQTGYKSLCRVSPFASFAFELKGDFLSRVTEVNPRPLKFSITEPNMDKRGNGSFTAGLEYTL